MEKLWDAVQRAWLVWAAFWFAAWSLVGVVLYFAISVAMMANMPRVNAVLAPLRDRVDAGLSVAAETVSWCVGFIFGAYTNASPGLLGYGWATVSTWGRVTAFLLMAAVVVWAVRNAKNVAEGVTTFALRFITLVLEVFQGRVERKVETLKVEVLGRLEATVASLSAPAPQTALPPQSKTDWQAGQLGRMGHAMVMPRETAWAMLKMNPEHAAGYAEKDARRLWQGKRSSVESNEAIDAAWAIVCRERGWAP